MTDQTTQVALFTGGARGQAWPPPTWRLDHQHRLDRRPPAQRATAPSPMNEDAPAGGTSLGAPLERRARADELSLSSPSWGRPRRFYVTSAECLVDGVANR